MKIGPPTGEGMDIAIVGKTVRFDMNWKQWDELVKDANYFRAYGKVREVKGT